MFNRWLNTDEQASWDKLIRALRYIQLNNVASDIEQMLLHAQSECVTSISLDNSVVVEIMTTARFLNQAQTGVKPAHLVS